MSLNPEGCRALERKGALFSRWSQNALKCTWSNKMILTIAPSVSLSRPGICGSSSQLPWQQKQMLRGFSSVMGCELLTSGFKKNRNGSRVMDMDLVYAAILPGTPYATMYIFYDFIPGVRPHTSHTGSTHTYDTYSIFGMSKSKHDLLAVKCTQVN